MNGIDSIISEIKIPKLAMVEQKFYNPDLENYSELLLEGLDKEVIKGRIKPGMKIAITAGSRGICDIDKISKMVVDFLKEQGTEPFFVTAMGSHGGATIKGQLEVLESLGITKKTMGCEVIGGTDSTLIEKLDSGIPVMIDTAAYNADAIVVINRVKSHTGFRGKYESGLMKMLAIGLGNHQGANYIHSRGLETISLEIEAIANSMLKHLNVIFGVAILENYNDKIGEIHVIPGEKIAEEEPELLVRARKMLAKIHFEKLDLLIVDRIGKNISGGGMDVNIIGGFNAPGVETTERAQRIAVLDLTDETHGAAFGIGDGDTTTKRLFDKIDFNTTYPNCLITCTPNLVKIPMVLDSQKKAIQAAIKMLLSVDFSKLRVVRIQDTLHIKNIQVSEALLEEAKNHPSITNIRELKDLEFDEEGNLF